MPEHRVSTDAVRRRADRPSARRMAEQIALDRTLIQNLAQVRRDKGLTQRQVAQRMGVHASVVSRIESADLDVHLSTLARYAHALGVRIVHLLREDA